MHNISVSQENETHDALALFFPHERYVPPNRRAKQDSADVTKSDTTRAVFLPFVAVESGVGDERG